MVSTHLKKNSQIGNLPQIGVKIKNIWNHHQPEKRIPSQQALFKSFREWNPTQLLLTLPTLQWGWKFRLSQNIRPSKHIIFTSISPLEGHNLSLISGAFFFFWIPKKILCQHSAGNGMFDPSTMSWLKFTWWIFLFQPETTWTSSSPFRHKSIPKRQRTKIEPKKAHRAPKSVLILFATFWGDLYRRKSLVTLNGLELSLPYYPILKFLTFSHLKHGICWNTT